MIKGFIGPGEKVLGPFRGAVVRAPDADGDPGRIRNERLMKILYGRNAGEVEARLATIAVLGVPLRFSASHGAAEALGRVAAKLEQIVALHPETMVYMTPFGGTYAWRNISKSPRLSAHSFGVCIDLNVEKGLYWQWNPDAETLAEIRRDYPQAIVDAFEAEGFIWGGKWHSFDFMHFEYRPELISPRRARE